MTITPEDVGRNPFNLFSLGHNSTQETPEGVRVKVSRHARVHLAGRGQESLRQRLGLKIDPATEDVVIIVGQTVASLTALQRQYKEDCAQAARAKQQATFDRLAGLLQTVNGLERNVGIPVTGKENLERRFEDPFDSELGAERAIKWLTERDAWLTVAQNLLPQINQLRSIFSDRELVVSRYGLGCSDWVASYDANVLELLIQNPELATAVEDHVKELYSKFYDSLGEIGFCCEELDQFPDYSYVAIRPVSGSGEADSQLFRDRFGFETGELTFSLAFQGDQKIRSLCWKDNDYSWSSIDALLLLQQITRAL